MPDAKPIAFDVADQQIVAQMVGAEAYLTEVRERPVTLNPRFGVLDPTPGRTRSSAAAARGG